MSFEQHQCEESPSRLLLNTDPPAETFTTESLLASILQHTEPIDDLQCPSAIYINPFSTYDHVQDENHTSTEHPVENQWLDPLAPGIRYLEQEPEQQFPLQHSTSMFGYLPPIDFAASTNHHATYDFRSASDSIIEWIPEWNSLHRSSSSSQPSYSPSNFEALTPQMSQRGPTSPTSTSSQLCSSKLQPPGDVRSPSDRHGQFTCEQCHKHKTDLKSLNRHMTEVHHKPSRGQAPKGWFTCVCGYQACYSRRSNYTRHLQKCKPLRRMHQEYICQCLLKHTDKAVHERHSQSCKEGAGHVGRPRRQA